MGLSRLLQPAGRGKRTGGAVRVVDLQPVELVHAADGFESGPSHRGDQVAAGFFVPGGASGGEWAATHGEIGGKGGRVEGVKSLLRAAADVVGHNCAAVGVAR